MYFNDFFTSRLPRPCLSSNKSTCHKISEAPFEKSSTVTMPAFTSILTVALTTFCLVSCQTPPGYEPSSWQYLEVTFDNNLAIHQGTILTPLQAVSQPQIHLPDVLNAFSDYIAFMIDLSVNHDGKLTTLLHWYQPGLRISNSDGLLLNLTDAGAAADYVGPQPPPGPDHIYMFLLFTQPWDYVFPDCFERIFPISVPTRVGFDIGQFMEVAGLDAPVAANYFVAGSGPATGTPPPRIWTTSVSSARCEKTAM